MINNQTDNDDTSEQVRLLNSLAKEDLNLHQSRQETIMHTAPNWTRLESLGTINKEEASQLAKLHESSYEQIDTMMHNTPGLVEAMVKVLSYHSDPHPSQYVLTLLYELVRDNPMRYDYIARELEKIDVFSSFSQIIYNPKADPYSADRAAFLLSSFICRNRMDKFNVSEINSFIGTICQQDSKHSSLTENGKVDAMINILKHPEYRKLVWANEGSIRLIKKCLQVNANSNQQYRGMFCVWLISFEPDLLPGIHEHGLDFAMCEIMKDNRREKIVRVFIKAAKNLMTNDNIVEVFIENDIFRVLTLLEYEKWRDPELYNDLKDGKFHLDKKIKTFSNFDRYCNELEKKSLKWSVLHSEKFWRENVMSFEHDEFSTIRKLCTHLFSDDSQTKAIACYDLGEFARFHPAGKKICQKFKFKDTLLEFIYSDQRDVAREALLCLQKLMLNNWQDLSDTSIKQ